MKKGFFLIVILVSCFALFSGCIKTAPVVTTINPNMSAHIGSYNFIAYKTVPSSITAQHSDTGTTLVITGYTSDQVSPRDRIVLTVHKYNGITNTYSMVRGEAFATYYHGNAVSYSLGGIVSIQNVTTTNISGYFSFTTQDGLSVSDGVFNVGLP